MYSNYSWGVDGKGRAHIHRKHESQIILSMIDGCGQIGAWILENQDVHHLIKKKLIGARMDIKKTNGYSITNNATEYLFESYEDAKFFKWGYKSGLSGLESKIKKKAYLLGYQEGANRARGRLNEAR